MSPDADLNAPPQYDTTVAPEAEVARDLVKRVGWVAPAFVVLGFAFWGVDGALSALFALGLVAANFAASAALISWGARISPSAILITVLGGYPLRMGVVVGAIWLVKDAGVGRDGPAGHHPAHHPCRAPVLGDPPRVDDTRLPRPGAEDRYGGR